MADDLTFSTAVSAEVAADRKQAEVGPPIKVMIDGEEVWFNAPTSAQFAMMLTGIQGSTPEAVAAMINFFFFLLRDEDKKREFRSRLWHPEDPFDEVVVARIGKALIERWSARPTQSPSGSSSSPSPSGPALTEQPQPTASTPLSFE